MSGSPRSSHFDRDQVFPRTSALLEIAISPNVCRGDPEVGGLFWLCTAAIQPDSAAVLDQQPEGEHGARR